MNALEPSPYAAFPTPSPVVPRLLYWLRHPVVAAVLVAAVLHLLWAVFFTTDGGDMAAQYAWAEFAGANPGSAYKLSWYGGMHPVSYSVLTYDGKLTPATYHAWLRRWAVAYVVLPDAAPDGAAVAEARIVAAGQPWLRPVWRDAHWRVYAVTDPVPLTSAPSKVVRAGQSELSVRVPYAGSFLVRVAWSPWLGVRGGAACLAPDGAWTRLVARDAEVFRIGGGYGIPRGTPCG